MSYYYAQPKLIEVGGVTFHILVGWKRWAVIQLATARLSADAQAYYQQADKLEPEAAADKRVELEERGKDIQRIVQECIVGWEGVLDENEQPVPFSMDALLGEGDYEGQGIDIGIINALMAKLEEMGEQAGREIAAERPT